MIRDAAKAVYRRLLPESLRERVSEAREASKALLNYVLMRSKLVNAVARVGAWPNTLYLEGTNICNARCVFCAYPQMERAKATMPVAHFKKVVDEHLALGWTEVDLTPIVGDPFVDKHLFERLDYLASRREVTRFHFYTNAILISPEDAERLLGYDERLWVFCSFGGFDRETYRVVMGVDKFDEAVAAIRRLIDGKERSGSRIRVQVNLRVPPGSEAGPFWDYLREKRANGLVKVDGVADFDNWGGMIKDEDLRAARLVPKPPPVHRGPCRRLVTGPTILVDGRVNACACRDVEATLIIGDTKTQSLGSLLDGPALQGLLARHERGDFPEICRTCTRYEPIYPAWMTGWAWPLFKLLLGGDGVPRPR